MAFDLSSGTAFALSAWMVGHGQAAISSLGRMIRRPVATGVTVLATAVALSLPFALYIMLDNAHRAMGGLDRNAQLTVFLRHDLDESQTALVAAALRRWDAVRHVRVVTRAEALAEYQQMTGFDDVETLFEGENPLPELIVVTPTSEGRTARHSSRCGTGCPPGPRWIPWRSTSYGSIVLTRSSRRSAESPWSCP